jgi:7 transmembrane sweet-taste receptor of 3 GCPR
MFDENTTNWKHFVDSNRNVLTILTDTLPIQLDLMQTSYVDALVGQLPYNMGYQGADLLLRAFVGSMEGIPLNETLPTDVFPITHQLEVLRIPLELPLFDFNYNYLGNVSIACWVLSAIIMICSLALIGWTVVNRKHQVIASSQPLFLILICFGTLLMGSAIIPFGIDDEYGQQAADAACMASPWLTFTGFTIAFSALFSKTWRLNKILLSKNPLRRIKVRNKSLQHRYFNMIF